MTVPRVASRNRAACGDDVCALVLEVIRNHDQSRFVRGATIAAWA
jgi:hypothetical protein